MENDRLAALWWLIALRGLRRSEAAALDRDDLDSEARELTISRQLVALPGELYCGPPKSRASIRTIALDEAGTRRLAGQAVLQTLELLQHQFTEQHRTDSRTRTGTGWRQGRPMFTYADGRPIRPEHLSHRFRTLVKELDLPPIRLHDLRHGAATLALALEVAGSALGDQVALVEYRDPAAELVGFFEILGGEENRNSRWDRRPELVPLRWLHRIPTATGGSRAPGGRPYGARCGLTDPAGGTCLNQVGESQSA